MTACFVIDRSYHDLDELVERLMARKREVFAGKIAESDLSAARRQQRTLFVR